MTTQELSKFIKDNEIEYHWDYDHSPGYDLNYQTVYIWMPYYLLSALEKLLVPGLFDDEGIECNWVSGYIVVNADVICDYYGINLDNVFERDGHD